MPASISVAVMAFVTTPGMRNANTAAPWIPMAVAPSATSTIRLAEFPVGSPNTCQQTAQGHEQGQLEHERRNERTDGGGVHLGPPDHVCPQRRAGEEGQQRDPCPYEKLGVPLVHPQPQEDQVPRLERGEDLAERREAEGVGPAGDCGEEDEQAGFRAGHQMHARCGRRRCQYGWAFGQ